VLTAASSSLKLVPFYLNLHLSAGFCPASSAPVIKTTGELLQYVRENKVKYFLWDEKGWRKAQVDIRSNDFLHNFNYLGDGITGTMEILFSFAQVELLEGAFFPMGESRSIDAKAEIAFFSAKTGTVRTRGHR